MRWLSRRTRRVLLVGAFLLGLVPAAAPAAAQETIAEAREELQRVEEQQLALKTRIDLLAAEDTDVFAALRAAEELVERQQAQVEAAQQQLRATIAVQRQNEAAVGWAQLDIEAARHDAADILVDVYVESGSENTVALLSSGDLTRGFRRLAMLDAVLGSTNDQLDQIRLSQDRYAEAVEQAAASVAEVERLGVLLTDDLAALQERRAQQALIKAELDKRRRALESEFAKWERDATDLESFIQVEEYRQKAAEWVRAQEAASATSGFVWPTAGRVGSGFGQRLHPILGVYRLHAGVDLGGTHGQPVYAARAGVVITAGLWGGYGNAVVIDHGDGLSSLYAHLSHVGVSTGSLVRSLEQIGTVGSTGLSTGPHLHLEVRKDGVPVDPLGYLP